LIEMSGFISSHPLPYFDCIFPAKRGFGWPE